MGKFKEKIYRFAYGRNGADALYYFGLVLFFVVAVTEFVLQLTLPETVGKMVTLISLDVVSIALFVWIIFRSMSRNLFKRRRENAAFLKIWNSFKRIFKSNTSTKTKSANRDDVYYIFRDCPKCSATLRLPRKAGKHSVKCPRCSHGFFVKSK